MKQNLLVIFLLLGTSISWAQDMPLGQWRDHFPHQDVLHVVKGGSTLYCAGENAMFSYDLSSTELTRMSKVNQLSDVGVSAIDYSESNNTLVVGFNNGNLDLINDEGTQNLPFIKINASLVGDKTINSVRFDGDKAYLSCGFGIVVVDLTKQEIKETYIIGTNNTLLGVNATTIFGDSIYAATNDGLYVAKADNPFLLDFNNWYKRTDVPSGANQDTLRDIFIFNDKLHIKRGYVSVNELYQFSGGTWQLLNGISAKKLNGSYVNGLELAICHNDSIEIYDTNYVSIKQYYQPFDFKPKACVVDGSVIYSASLNRGLVWHTGPTTWNSVFPKGPQGATAFSMTYDSERVIAVPGSASGSAWNNTNTQPGLSLYDEHEWTRYGYHNTPGFTTDTIFDVLSVAVDPNDDTHIYMGVHCPKGLVEFQNSQYVMSYDMTNSTLQDRYPGRMGVPDIKFDSEDNLWMTNLLCSEPLSVKTVDGNWYSFDVGLNDSKAATKFVIDDSDRKWIIQSGVGIAVVENEDPISSGNFQTRLLTSAAGNGGLPSVELKSIAIDLDGEIWVGTDAGPAVFYSADNVFGGGNVDAQQILLEQDGNLQLLLETEIISAIEIDGANRKWLGTENSGVFLMSEDGTNEILHFTAENSPLFSNTILSIEINEKTGEVFFSTDRGLISYKGNATKGDGSFSDVFAYPNPVKETYSGPIAIKGLARDSDVKITDISGRVVYFTTSYGGQAIWDGNNFSGERAKTGVYLVFASDQQGTFSEVTKILLVN